MQYNVPMSRRKFLTGLFAVILVAAVSGGGLAHSLVPHDHGEHGTQSESSVWTSLHSSLRHEQKKFLFDIAFLLANFLTTLALIQLAARFAPYARAEEAHDPMRGILLRTGVLAYRRFG